MSGRERYLVERIDRRREHTQAKEDRTARQKALEARASSFIACEIGNMPAEDQADYAQSLVAAVRHQLVGLRGPATASSILGQQAYEAARNILPQKIAAAAAEQAFARLQKPANDHQERDLP